MSNTTTELGLNPKHTALLVIDVQRALFEKSTPIYQADRFLANINVLIGDWRSVGGLVIFVQHNNQKILIKNSSGWQFHHNLGVRETDLVVHKTHGNAFQDTDLGQILGMRNNRNIVITGLVTQGCVRATCLGGIQLGYRVILASDGHSNYSKNAADIIEKWNQELLRQQIDIYTTKEIRKLIQFLS